MSEELTELCKLLGVPPRIFSGEPTEAVLDYIEQEKRDAERKLVYQKIVTDSIVKRFFSQDVDEPLLVHHKE